MSQVEDCHVHIAKAADFVNSYEKLSITPDVVTASSTSSPKEFHSFSKLPSELRLKIWAIILSNPRVLEIDCTRKIIEGERRSAVHFTSSTPPPPLLHVCQESRFEALAIYHAAFATQHSPASIYISFDQDTVQCPDSVLEYMGKAETAAVQRVILKVSDVGYFGHFHMETLKRMTKLAEVVLLTQPADQYSWLGEMFVEIIIGGFETERTDHPDWECPRVRIVSRETGEQLGLIEGGALEPELKEN